MPTYRKRFANADRSATQDRSNSRDPAVGTIALPLAHVAVAGDGVRCSTYRPRFESERSSARLNTIAISAKPSSRWKKRRT
jgi:hypothetical protein